MHQKPVNIFTVIPGLDPHTLTEFLSSLLIILYAPLYAYPISLRMFLQRRSFMIVTVFASVYVTFHSVHKAATWTIAFLLVDVWFRCVDKKNAEDAANS